MEASGRLAAFPLENSETGAELQTEMELTLEGRIVARARELGFDLCGIAPAAPRRGAEFRAWLKEGYGGRMTYLNRSVMRRTEPERILKGVRTVISVGQSYFTGYLPEEIRRDPSRGIIASYAWGDDYHVLMAQALQELGDFVREHVPSAATHWCVDAQPVLERDAAERAGLGFIGKNTMLIHPKLGSQFFLGEILTTADLTPSPPPRLPSCGSCTKCLDVCPTHAFPVPYVLDARLCVSYLTIELRGSIPIELRSKLGNYIFGCDDCQTCCPWVQRFSTLTRQRAYENVLERKAPKLVVLARLTEAEFDELFRGSAVVRPMYEGFMRNVAVALGNWGTDEARAALAALLVHESELVREHAEWASEQCR